MDAQEKPKLAPIQLKAAPIRAISRLHGQLSVISYPDRLLRLATRFMKEEEEFSIAVVVMHMACEIATERALATGSRAKSSKRAMKALNGFNLAKPNVLKLYTELTADAIEAMPFWEPFVKSAKLRNHVVHRSLIVNKLQAEESLSATSQLTAHLTKWRT